MIERTWRRLAICDLCYEWTGDRLFADREVVKMYLMQQQEILERPR